MGWGSVWWDGLCLVGTGLNGSSLYSSTLHWLRLGLDAIGGGLGSDGARVGPGLGWSGVG